MKIRTLVSFIASILLIAGLSLQAPSALASGTSSADLKVLAERGSTMAQRVLGKRYAMGVRGLDQDMNQAVYWLQKAADRGDGEAQYMLGVIYSQGFGIQQDWVKAHMWFTLAGSSMMEVPQKDREIAENNRKAVEAKMTPKQIEEAQALAGKWLDEHKGFDQTVASKD